MEFFVTGSIRPEEKLPLEIGNIEAGRGDSSCEDQTRGSRTISESGEWHFGQLDLMQWVPKSLMPGRNVMIGKSVKFRHCQGQLLVQLQGFINVAISLRHFDT